MPSFTPSNAEWAAGSLSVIFTLISLVCTGMNIHIIRILGIQSGYLRLIYSLTIMQCMYDIGLLLVPLYWVATFNELNVFLCTLGGIATALWSNVISLVVVYIVSSMKTFDIERRFVAIAFIVTAIALTAATGAAATVYDSNDTVSPQKQAAHDIFFKLYYWLRFISIIVNVVAYLVVSRKLSVMGFDANGQHKSVKPGARNAVHPVTVLADRLKWYPIVQAVSRLGASWYEYNYGDSVTSYKSSSDTLHDVALMFYAVFTPLAGVGYFIIFILMQRDAYEVFQRIMRASCFACCFNWCAGSPPTKHANFNEGAISARGSMDSVGSEIAEKIAAAAAKSTSATLVRPAEKSSAYFVREKGAHSHALHQQDDDTGVRTESGTSGPRTLSNTSADSGNGTRGVLNALMSVSREGSNPSGQQTSQSAATASLATVSVSASVSKHSTATSVSGGTNNTYGTRTFSLAPSSNGEQSDSGITSPLLPPTIRTASGVSSGGNTAVTHTVLNSMEHDLDVPRYSYWQQMTDAQLMEAIDASSTVGSTHDEDDDYNTREGKENV